MTTKVLSGALLGINGLLIDVECDVSGGLPHYDIVGLPDSAVRESIERVRSAINNSGYEFPIKNIVINLAPADTRKEGASFDLPIAVCVLAAMDTLPHEGVCGVFFAGELSLEGNLRPVKGILPMVNSAKKNGVSRCFVPAANAEEAALVTGVNVYAVESLTQLIKMFAENAFTPVTIDTKQMFEDGLKDLGADFSDVYGQDGVKRALTVAAAGGHNIIMIGPPGSGKTMMAKRVPSILPPLTFDESIEVTEIYSVAGLLREKSNLITKRPFRAPHHTISYSALTGGGRVPKPGEISLAHNGVLFLDELPEFQKNVLEVLRQPLEDKNITVSRVGGTVCYPCNFMLIASMNPCPCGHLGDSRKCRCSLGEVARYQNKVSGPLLDRIDIQVEAPAVNYTQLAPSGITVSSRVIREKVLAAGQIQSERYKNEKIKHNSELTSRQIQKYCVLNAQGAQMLKQAFDSIGLSARAYHKILKLSRTIADLSGEAEILPAHLAEAISYRSLDRKLFV